MRVLLRGGCQLLRVCPQTAWHLRRLCARRAACLNLSCPFTFTLQPSTGYVLADIS
jgi:hypothetical protein